MNKNYFDASIYSFKMLDNYLERLMKQWNFKGLGIKRILVNAPATVVFWLDGTKTVAKCGPNDTYDLEKGLFICMLKRQFNMNNSEFSKYMDYVNKKARK